MKWRKKCSEYDDKDIENISMIMTLYDAGFDDTEVKKYIQPCLLDENTAEKRTAMLTEKRKHTLDEIHSKQKQLDGIDYLRYKILQEKRKILRTEPIKFFYSICLYGIIRRLASLHPGLTKKMKRRN